jgi:LPXTG-site transpeptidase (sortase) family protein
MTEPEPRPGREGPRRWTSVGVGLAVVAVAIGIAIALSGGSAGSATPTPTPGIGAAASPALGDLPLVTVAPAASAPDAGSSVARLSPSPAVEAGIRANRIRIARLGIDLAIVEGDGIDAPIGKAAHYPSSAWPGGGSNIYIYGHARVGMFLPLWQIRLGDTVELDLVDGTARTYVVTEILPKVPFDAVKYLQPTPTEQLTLQTSTSYYATAPRFVVITVPKT